MVIVVTATTSPRTIYIVDGEVWRRQRRRAWVKEEGEEVSSRF